MKNVLLKKFTIQIQDFFNTYIGRELKINKIIVHPLAVIIKPVIRER